MLHISNMLIEMVLRVFTKSQKLLMALTIVKNQVPGHLYIDQEIKTHITLD